MTTTAIPSLSVDDFKSNIQDFDRMANGTGTYTDRFGDERLTLDEFMRRNGYEVPVAFASGIAVSRTTQTVTYNGDTYHAAPSAIPFTTTGTFNAAQWLMLRQNLEPQGIVLADKVITGFDATGLRDGAWVHFAGRDIVGDGGGGPLRFLAGSTATANGVTIYAVTGGRLVREGWSIFGINVKWAGAKGSPSDDTFAFQTAIDAANAIGGCRVYVPAGIYLIDGTLTLYTKVEIIGEASGSTRIRQTNNAATLIKSYQFDTLTGGTSNGGIRRAALKGLTLEASLSAGIPVGTNDQHGVQIYGYGNEIDDVHIRYFGGMGYYSEWRTPGVAPDSGYDDGFVEDRIGRLKCYLNGLSGIVRDGAHDGQWNRVISYSNNLSDASTDKPNVWIKSKGNPQYIDQLHAWGSTSAVALLLEGSAKLSNCAIEGATSAQVLIKTGEVEIVGGEIFMPGAGGSAKGIRFVGGSGVCIGYKIDTVIRGCNGGSIDFGAGIDAAEVKARIYQTSGALFVGTMPSAGAGNFLEFTAAGGADNRGGTKKKHYHATLTNLSLVDSTSEGLEYAQHGGEGVFSFPQRKTEPSGTYYPPSGVIGYGRVNAIRLHQSSSNTVGAILGEPATPATPADNLDCSNFQLISLASSASPVTITNLVGGLNGSPFFLLMPAGGAEITLANGTGNIRTKTGANVTRSGLGANRMISFVKARDGNYYQV